MREFIEYIAKSLVDHPDGVVLEQEEKDNKTVFKLKVGEGDIGKIIGRKGRTAQAMRVLLSAVAAKERKRAILEIQD
ncbi:MAG: KH domain-containing protein [Bacteroidota bacterium]